MALTPYNPSGESPRRRPIPPVVESRFSRFGEEVVELIGELARNPSQMAGLFERLDIAPKPDLNAQLDALAYYIAQSGPEAFIRRARIELWKVVQKKEQTRREESAADPLKRRLPTAQDEIREDPRDRRIRKMVALASAGRPAPKVDPPQAEPIPPMAEVAMPDPVEAEPIASAPEIAPAPEEAPAPQPTGPYIETPEFTGYDRRLNTADRRSHQDRRSTLEAVRGNKRFGKDRRQQPRGRRKSDTSKPAA